MTKFDKAFLNIAQIVSNLSYAKKLKVGAIIVKDNRIISMGYNGTPSGWSNECEDEVDGKMITKSIVIHAEENAIAKLASSTESGVGATMYCTHSPCIHCARLIANVGINEFHYMNVYRSSEGLEYMAKSNILIFPNNFVEPQS